MTSSSRPSRIGFLLTQLGTDAASRFAARTKELGVTPGQAGVIRILGRQPGISQRDLADRLGAVQSRVVALIDGLEGLDLVTRERNAADRRNYELRLTDRGQTVLGALRGVAEAHEADVTKALNDAERAELSRLLGLMLAETQLDADVHPGYKDLG